MYEAWQSWGLADHWLEWTRYWIDTVIYWYHLRRTISCFDKLVGQWYCVCQFAFLFLCPNIVPFTSLLVVWYFLQNGRPREECALNGLNHTAFSLMAYNCSCQERHLMLADLIIYGELNKLEVVEDSRHLSKSNNWSQLRPTTFHLNYGLDATTAMHLFHYQSWEDKKALQIHG